jgi:hypothetical protein
MHEFEYYLKRPFEVFYATIPVSEFELLGVLSKTNALQSVALKRSFGTLCSQTFKCESNGGQELLCCLLGQHDEVKPPWLEHVFRDLQDHDSEEEWGLVNLYSGLFKDETIKFKLLKKPQQEKLLNLPSLNLETLLLYELSIGNLIDPQYYVLDANHSRVKINPEGVLLTESDDSTGISLFNSDDLWDMLTDFAPESLDVWEAKNQWIKKVLSPYFPDDAPIELAADSD